MTKEKKQPAGREKIEEAKRTSASYLRLSHDQQDSS
jgi:hypothetical protein